MTKLRDGQNIVTGPADQLLKAAADAEKTGSLPPVHLWNPPFCGDLDMEIRRDGTWFHEGTPIGRPKMVRLFSTILKREGDKYFLVTPVEKVGIRVVDAPFVAVDFAVEGDGDAQDLTFTTNVGDQVCAGPGHDLCLRHDTAGEPSPYIHVRAGLEALIDRKTFYRLVELGSEERIDGRDWFGLWSAGQFFPFLPASELHDLS